MPYREIGYDADGPVGYLPPNNPARIHAPAFQMAESRALPPGIGKQAFCGQVDMSDEKALACGARTTVLNCLAEDARIGIQAFLEKNTPEWKNR